MVIIKQATSTIYSKPAILALISFLTAVLIYGSYSSVYWISAFPVGPVTCERTGTLTVTCCPTLMVRVASVEPGAVCMQSPEKVGLIIVKPAVSTILKVPGLNVTS